MKTVFERPHALIDTNLHYCPGCTHGIIHRLVAESLDELELVRAGIATHRLGTRFDAWLR